MGQKEKARQVVATHEFRMVATASEPDCVAAFERHAAIVAPGGFKGSLKKKGEHRPADDQLVTTWAFRPKGQVGGQAAMILVGFQTIGPDVLIQLQIESFNYQKGPLGMKPHFPGGNQLDTLRDALVAQLNAAI